MKHRSLEGRPLTIGASPAERTSRTRLDFAAGMLALLAGLGACGGSDGSFAQETTGDTIEVVAHDEVADRSDYPLPAVPTRAADDAPWAFAPVTAELGGATWRAHDRADADGVFDVVLETPRGTQHVVAESPAHQAHAALAADLGGEGRLWLAFERGGEDWGQGGALRRTRRVDFGAIGRTATGRPTWIALPTPFDDAEVEAPTLAVDAAGVPWLFVRALKRAETFGTEGNEEAANRRVAWVLEAAALTADGWTAPITLPDSSGPEDGALEVAREGDGLVARYFTDGRAARFIDDALTGPWDAALPGAPRWHTAQLRLDGGEAPPALPPELGKALPDDTARIAPRPESAFVWGDLHRHTDASRCKIDEDGDLLDAYRYALGTARLDFMAVTDHFQHMNRTVWERELAAAEAFDALPGFVAFAGYERALPLGHWTMVGTGVESRPLADGVFAPYRPRFLWDEHPASDWLAIPHQLTDRAAPLTWDQVGELDPVVEVFQSRRGAYEARHGWRRDLGGDPEAKWAQDYLGEGRVLGFVASSDHATTTTAFTGVRLAPGVEATRASIVAGLRARHTVAASVRGELELSVRTGDTEGAPGDVLTIAPGAALQVTFATTVPGVNQLELVHGRPGEAPRTVTPAGAAADPDAPLQAQLFLRLGRTVNARTVVLDFKDATPGDALVPFELEPEDALSGANADQVRLETTLSPRDEDGLLVPVTLRQGAKVVLTVQSPGKRYQKETRLDKLLGRPGELFWSAGARTDLRLDPLPADLDLAGSLTLDDARPGDWLYLRAMTAAGDVLWTSPVFLR